MKIVGFYLLVLTVVYLLSLTSCKKDNEFHPKYKIGDVVNLNDITLPGTGYVAPLTIRKEYWDDVYQQNAYDATDSRDTMYYHFTEKQLKK